MSRSYRWNRKKRGEEWNPGVRVSDEELLNRVILAKALQVYASHKTLVFKTDKENFEITPVVAREVMRVAGRLPKTMNKRNRKPTSSKRV